MPRKPRKPRITHHCSDRLSRTVRSVFIEDPSVQVHFRHSCEFTFRNQSAHLISLLKSAGFLVQPLPEHILGFSASHSRAHTVTLFLLQHHTTLADWNIFFVKDV